MKVVYWQILQVIAVVVFETFISIQYLIVRRKKSVYIIYAGLLTLQICWQCNDVSKVLLFVKKGSWHI